MILDADPTTSARSTSSGRLSRRFREGVNGTADGRDHLRIGGKLVHSAAAGRFAVRHARSIRFVTDTTPPPTAPAPSAKAIDDCRVRLAWEAVEDPDSPIAGYRIYRDGKLVATAAETEFIDDALAETTTYSYQVAAVNASDLEGPKSRPVKATTGKGAMRNTS